MYLIPNTLKHETKIFKRLYIRDILYIGLSIMIAFTCRKGVHLYLQFPYWVFTALLSFYFVLRPKDNPGKRKISALMMFLLRDNNTYYSIDAGGANRENTKEHE